MLLDLGTLGQRFGSGELSPSQLLRDLYPSLSSSRCVFIKLAQLEDLLAAAQVLEAMPAEQRAAKPLWGIPFAVKDNVDVAGFPTTAGCPAFAYPAVRSAPAVEALQAAGAC